MISHGAGHDLQNHRTHFTHNAKPNKGLTQTRKCLASWGEVAAALLSWSCHRMAALISAVFWLSIPSEVELVVYLTLDKPQVVNHRTNLGHCLCFVWSEISNDLEFRSSAKPNHGLDHTRVAASGAEKKQSSCSLLSMNPRLPICVKPWFSLVLCANRILELRCWQGPCRSPTPHPTYCMIKIPAPAVFFKTFNPDFPFLLKIQICIMQ